ncbi:hypothetical protein [Nocardia farcinica]|uniref:hypothetical protein n=1 Tax=Nocardia farcinica TaxID=37329 RepID=UPI00189432BD|nr:hypothetical protein [Nocardia farcinica]MBF6411270.1 hypothetical protein [Nocardia farcinica]UEX26223.1 hypothetical protein LMJ57_30190 [Nocardia farcinica]
MRSSIVGGVIAVNTLVRIRPAAVSRFRVLDIDGDHATIEAADDVPGRYPFRMRLADLIPDDQAATTPDYHNGYKSNTP